MLRQFPIALFCMTAGGILSVVGTFAYIFDFAALNIGGLFYGVPLLLGGFALKITELTPVPFVPPTPPEVLALKESQATLQQTEIIKDVTRYRYGQEAHMDSALKFLGLRPTSRERPVLIEMQETTTDGAYTLILRFASPFISFDRWEPKAAKMTTFFGPGVRVELSQTVEDQVNVAIISLPESTG
jgi:Protein of unknown function (DUF2854)